MSDTDTLTVLKLLANGRLPALVADMTGVPLGRVQSIADEHGWPERAKLQEAVDGLVLDGSGPLIPVREPIPPFLSTPAVRRPRPAVPVGGTTNGVAKTPHPGLAGGGPVTVRREDLASRPSAQREDLPAPPGATVDELVRACRRSGSKRTQALGPKLAELAEKVTAALRAERETAEAKAKQAEAFTAKKAAVERLAKQLADARAELRGLKPTGVTEAALDFACGECGDLFTTSQGRGMHARRKHGIASPNTRSPIS